MCMVDHAGNCSAPIFSFTKPWKQGCTAAAAGTTTAASHGNSSQRCSPYDDILHPVMNHPFDHLIDFPWHLKSSKAFMRAGVYAAMARNCSRVLVYRMANSRAGQKWLDVGIYKNRHPHVKLKTVGGAGTGWCMCMRWLGAMVLTTMVLTTTQAWQQSSHGCRLWLWPAMLCIVALLNQPEP